MEGREGRRELGGAHAGLGKAGGSGGGQWEAGVGRGRREGRRGPERGAGKRRGAVGGGRGPSRELENHSGGKMSRSLSKARNRRGNPCLDGFARRFWGVADDAVMTRLLRG
jgi:hypothetical protein